VSNIIARTTTPMQSVIHLAFINRPPFVQQRIVKRFLLIMLNSLYSRAFI
jgi:hypothetical protein